MSLRIACDLDGTLADMDAALQREARRLFGPDVDLHAGPTPPLESAEDVEGEIAATGNDVSRPSTDAGSKPQTRPLTRAELRKLWAHVGEIENFWRSLGEIEPGAVARLAALASRRGWEVLFLTQRPPSRGDTAQLQSQRWLSAHGFEFPSVFVMNGSRGRVAAALSLDAVLDDRPDNCLDVVADSKATPFLVWRYRPESAPAGVRQTRIQTVFSIAEALDRLDAMSVEPRGGRTLMGRVRAAMGL